MIDIIHCLSCAKDGVCPVPICELSPESAHYVCPRCGWGISMWSLEAVKMMSRKEGRKAGLNDMENNEKWHKAGYDDGWREGFKEGFKRGKEQG